jgi:hypothetical protein
MRIKTFKSVEKADKFITAMGTAKYQLNFSNEFDLWVLKYKL